MTCTSIQIVKKSLSMNIINTIRIALLAVSVSIFAWSCTGGSGPDATAKKFLNAMSEGDAAKAKKLVSDTANFAWLEMMGFSEMKGKKYEITKTEFTNEDKTAAIVKYKWEGSEEEISMNL